MALRGTAFLAIWNDIEPSYQDEFDIYHTFEHLPERLSTPGISVGRRYVDYKADRFGYFTIYEADRFEVFASEGYFSTGNAPTEATVALQARFTSFSRAPCHTIMTRGGGIGGALATIRIDFPREAVPDGYLPASERFNAAARQLADPLSRLPGAIGVHLGLAGQVDRKSVRANSLNNRPDLVSFDAVILIEAISRRHLTGAVPAIDGILRSAPDVVGDRDIGIYELAQFVAKAASS